MAYDGFYLTYQNDEETQKRFERVQSRYPNFRLVKINLEDWDDPKIDKAIMKIAGIVNTKYFWIIDPDVEVSDDFDFDFDFRTTTEVHDPDIVHVWNAEERNAFRYIVGVKLFKASDVKEKKEQYIHDAYFLTGEYKDREGEDKVKFLPTWEYKPIAKVYDIFYWDRPYGKENLRKLQERVPQVIPVQADDNVSLHKKLKEISTTEYYYLVHPNTEVFDDFNFDYFFALGPGEDKKRVVVWLKENVITGDVREYHGVGLFPKDMPLFKEKEYNLFNFRRKGIHEKHPISRDVKFPVIRTNNLHDFPTDVDADMYWLVHENVKDFQEQDFYPTQYERGTIHNFKVELPNGTTVRNGVRLVPHTPDLVVQLDHDVVKGRIDPIERVEARTVEEAVELANDYMFWMVNPDLQLTDTTIDDFYPDLYDTGPTHIWKFSSRKGDDLGYGGLAFSNKDYNPHSIIYHEEFAARIPDKHNIKKYYTRDPYKAYTQAKKHVFYWVVDTVVELVDDFDFDFYPDIHSIENVFAFKSEGDADAGVYLVHRPHLEKFNPSEEDFSFDRFKNIIRVDKVASRAIGHPAFYFDEGMYSDNTTKFTEHKNIDVIDATDLAEAYQRAATLTKTGYFWAIDNDVETLEDFDRSFYIDRHHKSHFHLWPKMNPYTGYIHQFGGLKLVPASAIKELKPDADKLRKMNFKNKKPVKKATVATRDIPYDVVMLSYKEPFADQNFEKLLERVPNAKRVHGVKGIFNAHKRAAEIADTRMFYVIDADAILLEDFEFEYFPSVWDEDIVHTWKSKNPVNDLIYGYGGLKLFPTKLLRDATDWHIDFTTSISEKFKPMPIAANYTAFNTDPFNTWKSAFRECTKLSSSIIHRSKQDENDERLEAWCNKGADREFGEYAIAGARAGRAWGELHADNDEMLGKINDFEWLQEKFEEENNE